jgi:putative flippase GtrA
MQTITQIITKIIDFFYRPFSRYIPQQLFRYAFCGGSNLVFDWVLYFLLYNFVIGHELVYISLPLNFKLSTLNYEICLTPHILTFLIVFPITLFTGFWLNRNITFTQSSLRGYKQLWRYILIVALNLLINYLGLKLCVDILGFYPTPSKMLITLVTVAISFFGQKYFSFKK